MGTNEDMQRNCAILGTSAAYESSLTVRADPIFQTPILATRTPPRFDGQEPAYEPGWRGADARG